MYKKIMSVNQIIIIGVQPPCPRCKLLGNIIDAKVEELNIEAEVSHYNNSNWTFELDEVLRPFENQARVAGIMMTPVLIINGELKHQGSVPSLSKINEWLFELN